MIGNDLYNNAGAGELANGVTDRPVVADPAGTEMQQAYLQRQRGDSLLRLGRQEILLGDQRFVGNVGWRQNHQSFDALTFSDSSLEKIDLFYGYLDNVNRINGGHQQLAGHLLSVGVEPTSRVKLTLYGLLLDYDDPAQFALSTATYGAEASGRHPIGDSSTVLWELEYADQRDFGDNPNDVSASYVFVLAGAVWRPLTLKLGYEVLEGSPEDGQFRTPLATLHKFNGWADKFLVTPLDGLRDLFLQAEGKAGAMGWTLVLHDFGADTGGADYGRELDLQLTYTASWKQVFAVKGALYDAEEFAQDTTKWMVFTTFKI